MSVDITVFLADSVHTDEEFEKLVCISSEGMPPNIRMDFFRFSDELQSEMAKKLQYLIPQGLRWFTGPILSSVFDKKLLNLDTEHFKGVSCACVQIVLVVIIVCQFVSGPSAGRGAVHLPGGLRPHRAHHQHHRGAAEQLRPAATTQLSYSSTCVRLERCSGFVCNSR